VEAIKIIASIYRDFGNRSDRKQARLKYLINEMGVDWFLEEFRNRAKFEIGAPRVLPKVSNEDWLGAHRQNDTKWFYGLFVENGRIKDEGQNLMRTAIRQIVVETNCDVTLTPQQSIIFAGLTQEQLQRVEEILAEYGLKTVDELSAAVRYSMACPAMPTCGMAVAESERVAPTVVRELESRIGSGGMNDEPYKFRITGLPNRCSKP
ncbi:MAG: hypothetical protein AAGA30_20850, partial [Planctomycetota bacterium]